MLPLQFSEFMSYVAAAAIIAVLILVESMLASDRVHNVHHLQYAAAVGRRIVKIQLGAVMLSALALSLAIIGGACAIFFSRTNALSYWNARMMQVSKQFWMYNITFGQYVILQGAMATALSIGAAGLAFVMSRFSVNYVSLMIKTVPIGVALGFIALLGLASASNNHNPLAAGVFGGRFDWPEVWVCGVVMAVGVASAVAIVIGEKRAAA
ncbi:hypothetical protein FACS1894184_02940 [Clostridia bacterium]|nr:hypothetical protein FACS1894184_02940 [Clostridia bacterium]